MAGRKVAVTAEQLHGAEREEAWRQITTASPHFAGYRRKTGRELPVIRLNPDPASQTLVVTDDAQLDPWATAR